MTKRVKPPGVGIGLLPPAHLVSLGQALAKIHNNAHVWTLSGVLPDWAIRHFITIDDFVDYGECPPNTVSYGLTSAGYDLRVGHVFKVFTNAHCAIVDPRAMTEKAFVTHDLTPEKHDWDGVAGANGGLKQCRNCGQTCYDTFQFAQPCGTKPNHILLPPNSFALASSIEKLYIPRNVTCSAFGKSTYARCGVVMPFTPFEAGWFGAVTIEIANSTTIPIKIYAGQGICQAQFSLLAGNTERSYGEKPNSRYQNQEGITLARVI